MRSKSKSNNNLIQSDDLRYEEEVEENGICKIPIEGNMVAQFSFADNSCRPNESMLKAQEQLKDNKTIKSYPYCITPPVNGEYFDTSYERSFTCWNSRLLLK